MMSQFVNQFGRVVFREEKVRQGMYQIWVFSPEEEDFILVGVVYNVDRIKVRKVWNARPEIENSKGRYYSQRRVSSKREGIDYLKNLVK